MKGKITNTGQKVDVEEERADKRNKNVKFKNCAPFSDCIIEIHNTQVENSKDLDVVILMYNLIEYIDKYSKSFGRLWPYDRGETNAATADSGLLKFKLKITEKTPYNNHTKDVEITVPLKFEINFWRTLEMLLISCGINIILS